MKIYSVFFVISFISLFSTLMAQDNSLLRSLDSIQPEIELKTLATFKGTRISIGQSIVTRQEGALEVTWQNRFWNTPTPSSDSFVADKVNSRLELAYGVTDRLTLGAAYGTGYNSIDAFAKYRLLYQKDTGSKFPVSVSLYQSIAHREKNPGDFLVALDFEDEFGFTTQVLIARKFTSNFSFQVSPTYIHRRADRFLIESNENRFALGFGARYRLGGHVSVVSEYYYLLDPLKSPKTYGPFSLGVNWEVSKILLQFKLTNARNLVEDKFIGKSTQNFNTRNGNLHFGFQATYLLHFKKK